MLQTLKDLPLAFYSAPYYKRLVLEGKGIAIALIVIAALFSTLAIGARLPFDILTKDHTALFDSLPDITVKNGVLSMDAPAPQEFPFLEGIEGGPFKIVLDPRVEESGYSAIAEKMRKEKIIVFVTSRALLVSDPVSGKLEIQKFSDSKSLVITHSDWIDIGKIAANITPFGWLLVSLLTGFLNHLISALAGGLLLLFAGFLLGIKVPYKGMVRLAAAAKIPVAFLQILLLPSLWIQGLLWFGFASFGLFATRNALGKAPGIS